MSLGNFMTLLPLLCAHATLHTPQHPLSAWTRTLEMIDPASGVEALIKAYASERPYIEYTTASGTQFPPLDRSARYIKTESHKRFSIVVKLPTTFDFKDATSVNVTCSVYAGNCVSRGDRVRCSKIFKRQTPDTGPFTLEIDSLTACGSEGYRLCGLCFGEGETTGRSSASDDLTCIADYHHRRRHPHQAPESQRIRATCDRHHSCSRSR